MTELITDLTNIEVVVNTAQTTEITVNTLGGPPGPIGPQGPPGTSGGGGGSLPSGGALNQVLTKNSNASGDASWKDALVKTVAGKTGNVTLAEGDIANLPSDLADKYSSGNPPPYPVTSVAGQTGAVVLAEPDIVGLPGDLALKAPLDSPIFTTKVTVPATVSATDAAQKAYVDAVASGLSVKTAVNEATTAALPVNTYNNGSSGVGATLTGNSTGVLTTDDQVVALNDRILVKDEGIPAHNGIYVCTTAGAIGVAYVLTRASDLDLPSQIKGAFTFVETGTLNTGSGFVVTGEGPFTIGTTAITWTQFSSVGSSAYTNSTPTPATLGGIPAGSIFSGVSLDNMFTNLLYPYQHPAFSSFIISGQATIVEVGTTIGGSKTFTWGTTNPSNIASNTIDIADESGNLDTGHANSGSDTLTIPNRQLTAPGTYDWTIAATDTEANSFSRNFTVTWYWQIYHGTSASTTLDETAIEALTGQLAASGLATYSYASGNYKYLCYPATLPAASLFTDTLTGFDVTMADVTDNPAYSNTANGYSYALVSVTNAQGITTNYRVYRTKFVLGSSINIRVT